MLTEQRYQIILDLLKEKKSVTATELKEILDTSESTVRRDITALHKAGKLIKVFGGAVALEDEGTVSAYEPTVEQKSELYVEEKRKIAQYAAELIEEEDFIYLDAGTTTGYMIDALGHTNAVFVTNAVSHAQRLAAKGIKVFLIGGELKNSTEAVIGYIFVSSMRKSRTELLSWHLSPALIYDIIFTDHYRIHFLKLRFLQLFYKR